MNPDEEKFVEEIRGRYNLPAEEAAAAKALVEYAGELEPREANGFLEQACESLGLRPLHINFTDFPSRSPDSIAAGTDGNEVFLAATRDGVKYLRAVLEHLELSTADVDFVYLGPESGVLHEHSLTLTLSSMEKLPSATEDEPEEESCDGPLTPIDPRDIFALQFIDILPDELPLTPGKLYHVEGIAREIPFDSWRKRPQSRDASRNVPFVIIGDDGTPQYLTVCLDDPSVLFFSREEIENLLR